MKSTALVQLAAGLVLTAGLSATTAVPAQDLPSLLPLNPAAKAATPEAPALKTLLVTSFEDPAVCAKAEGSGARASSTDLYPSDGRKSAALEFDAGNWQTITFPAGTCYSQTDWRGYEAIILEAYNPGNEADMLVLSLRDDANRNWGCMIDVPAKQNVRLAFALNLPKTTMKGYPLVPTIGADAVGYFNPQDFNLANVTSFQFIRWGMKEKSTLYVDNLRLCVVPPVGKFVDRYGQSNLSEWPGKIHSDQDLVTLHQAEAADLRKAPLPPGRDEWGGAANGPKLKATGWFRTEKRDGKWWLVTPTGHLFWSVGIDCIGPGISGPIYDEYMSWLPDDADPLSRFFRKGSWVDFGSMNLQRAFGPDYEKSWLDLTRKRMQAWGFNTIGNWSSEKVCSDLRIPFTFPMNTSTIGEFPGGNGNIADFFNDEWRKASEDAIRTIAERWNTNPLCIGYFVDNEMKWPSPDVFATNTLGMSGDRAVKKADTDLLRSRYGDIAKLTQAWGTDVKSWEDFLAKPVLLPAKRSAALQADQKLLLSAFAERYFSTMAALVKKHAPNQLYLGSRFAGPPAEEVARAAAKYCDVISYNIYGKDGSVQDLTKSVAAFDKPVMIGEFHFGALDRGMFSGGVVPVANQEERGIQYARYIKAALAQPWCVGAHWFQYSDQMLTGRGDGENYNIGFVSVADVPYPELVRHATATNFDLYQDIAVENPSSDQTPLDNSGFEIGLTGWQTSGAVRLETADPIAEKQSARLGPGLASISQRCPLDNSGHLYLIVKLKGAPTGVGQVVLRLLGRDGKKLMEFQSPNDFSRPDQKSYPGYTHGIYLRPHALTAFMEVTISTGANDGAVLVDDVIAYDWSTNSRPPRCDLDQYMQPFWNGRTVYNETVLLLADQGGLATGRLLYTPTKIISVRNPALDKTYELNRDFTVAQRTLTATAGSPITQMRVGDYPTGEWAYVELSDKQVVVTYEHDDTWTGPAAPAFAGPKLPRTMEKLLAHTPLHVVALGDSITFGLNVSRILDVSPYMPTWAELFVHRLKTVYQYRDIILYNIAESGKATDWAVRMQEPLMAGLDADLVILAFGMNDFWNVEPAEFKSRIATIMTNVRKSRPDAEFLLVSAMCYDPAYTSNSDYLRRQAAYPAVLKELCATGVQMVDMTAISSALYDAKKPKDCTSNPMHPNDYLARWYAQGLMALLEQPVPTISAIAPTSGSIVGGSTVTITGTNLVGTTAVSFGGTAATAVTVVNATTVTCVAPAHASGTVNVELMAPGGAASSAGGYSYVAPALPVGWTSEVIGAASPAGSATGDGQRFTLSGSGVDIWNKADAFRYAWQTSTGDFDAVVKVDSQIATNGWAKAGLMVRESTSSGSRHMSCFVSPGYGTAMQYRTATSGSSSHVAGPQVDAPTWLKLTRRGSSFSTWQSADGITWKLIGTRTVALPAKALLGLAVTSHLNGSLSTAVFSGFTCTPVSTN